MLKRLSKSTLLFLVAITLTISILSCDSTGGSMVPPLPDPEPHGIIGLDPNEDTDGDGLSNFLEALLFTDPLDYDTDDDGLVDGPAGSEDQNGNGFIDPGETDPTKFDTDGDTIPDGTELGLVAPTIIAGLGGTDLSNGHFIPDADPLTTTNPLKPDTDGDGIPDGAEDANRNGKVDPGETNPSKPDTDDDGLVDGLEIAIGTDPINPDTDGDGLLDGEEVSLGTDPINPDTDGDGLLDGEEVSLGTDPNLADSDGDGYSDSEEIAEGTDPLDINSYPVDTIIWVGKAAQLQCEFSCEPLFTSMMEVNAAGVTILDSTAGTYNMLFITVCGAPNGYYNFIKISSGDLAKLSSGWGPVDEAYIIPGPGCSLGISGCFPEDPCCGTFIFDIPIECIIIWP